MMLYPPVAELVDKIGSRYQLVNLVARRARVISAEAEEKEYLAAFRPGLVTDTQDITGNRLAECGVLPGVEDVKAALDAFIGQIEQIPPMYSAVKVNGQKLYQIARRGGEVERAARKITIYSIEHMGTDGGDHILRIRCSKGTYIRTLCHDLGQALGCGGCMAALRRTASGAFRVEDARRIGQISRADAEHLIPIDALFSDFPAMALTEEQERRCRCGNPFPADAADGQYRLYAPDGAFLALGRAESGMASAVKSFFEVN